MFVRIGARPYLVRTRRAYAAICWIAMHSTTAQAIQQGDMRGYSGGT